MSPFEIVSEEFAALGIRVESINVHQDAQPIQSMGSLGQPVGYVHGRELMEINFICAKDQFEYFKPMVRDMKIIRVPVPPPVYVVDGRDHWHDPTLAPQRYEEEIFCKGTIHLALTGGSMQPWLEQFREMTSKLRYSVESAKFDKEVEEELSDGYNK